SGEDHEDESERIRRSRGRGAPLLRNEGRHIGARGEAEADAHARIETGPQELARRPMELLVRGLEDVVVDLRLRKARARARDGLHRRTGVPRPAVAPVTMASA